MMVMELMEQALHQLLQQSLHQHQLKRLFLSSMKRYLLSMRELTYMDLEEALLEAQRLPHQLLFQHLQNHNLYKENQEGLEVQEPIQQDQADPILEQEL